jgi:DNA-binding transcriptional LysR family regulator
MVAEGLGVTLLPEFSVLGDPLERGGFITCRPLDEDPDGIIELVLRRRRSTAWGRSALEMHRLFVEHASVAAGTGAGTSEPISTTSR